VFRFERYAAPIRLHTATDFPYGLLEREHYKNANGQSPAAHISFVNSVRWISLSAQVITMPTKLVIVKTGDILEIPALNEDEKRKQVVTVEWSQDLGKRYKEDYYLVKAINKSQGRYLFITIK
jgi:hypothetical protein